MTVTLRLFAGLGEKVHHRSPERFRVAPHAGIPVTLDLEQGATVASVIDTLWLDPAEVLTMFINGRARDPDHVLAEGDQIGLFPPIGGG